MLLPSRQFRQPGSDCCFGLEAALCVLTATGGVSKPMDRRKSATLFSGTGFEHGNSCTRVGQLARLR